MTIKQLKKFIAVFNKIPKVNINSIDKNNDFCREYDYWEDFIDDDSIDDLELIDDFCVDIFEYEIEIWVK